MRHFVIEDGVDVSVYSSIELAIRAIEPKDIPRMRLFDELGNEHTLSINRRKVRVLGIWPTIVTSTMAGDISGAAAYALKKSLWAYAQRASIKVPPGADLSELVNLIAAFQEV